MSQTVKTRLPQGFVGTVHIFSNTVTYLLNGIRNSLMMIQWDTTILGFFHTLRTPGLDTFFEALTWLGSMWVLLPLSLLIATILAWRYRLYTWWYALYLPATLILASLTTWLLKRLIGRDRPQLFEAIVALPADMAFPSGHTTQASAFFLALWLMSPVYLRSWLLLPVIIMIAVIAASRLYLQVHWFSDVLVGAVIGGGYAIGIWLWMNKNARNYAQ